MSHETYASRKSRLLKQFDRSVSRVKQVLVARYGEEEANTLMRESRHVYQDLIPQIPYIGDRNPLLKQRQDLLDFALALMAVAVLLLGCGPSPGNSSSLQDTRWVLVTLRGEPPLPGRAASAEFSADQISGSAGCNTYFGTYAASDSEISVSDVANTEMWCSDPEGVMDQEQAFLAALASAASYRIAGERLELLDGTGRVILIFEPKLAVP